MTLEEMWKRIARTGPSHIVTAPGEQPVLRQIAQRDYQKKLAALDAEAAKKGQNTPDLSPDLQWDIIYFRNTGMTIGCDFYTAQYVEGLFRGEWIGIMTRGARRPRPLRA